jgi:hypothetical protein
MTWAQRLKRVFNIDIEVCSRCGGSVRVMPKALAALAGQALACIENQDAIPDKAGPRPDPGPSSREGKGSSCPAPSGTANQGATCHAVSFRRDGVESAGTPLKTPWHGLLRALVQEWTNMNCTVTSAKNFSGQSGIISRIYPVQSAVSVRKSTPDRPFIFPRIDAPFVNLNDHCLHH